MKIYLASSYSRREEVAEYARLLEEDGHASTAYWLTGGCADWPPQKCAANDAANLAYSDCIVCCTGAPTTSGGHHVEFGMAAILGLRLVVVGPRQNVFHHRPDVEQYATFEEARQVLKYVLPSTDKLSEKECARLHSEDWQQARSGIVESTGMMNWCPTCNTYRS